MEPISFDLVSQPHNVCKRGQIARYDSGHYIWDESQEVRSHHAVIAYCSNKMVGVLKFNVRQHNRPRALVMRSVGTFVWHQYRHLGLGTRLWDHALESYDFTEVNVSVVSDKGKTLVESLRTRYPKMDFTVLENGDRPLRDLKGQKIKTIRRAA